MGGKPAGTSQSVIGLTLPKKAELAASDAGPDKLRDGVAALENIG